MEYYDLYLMAIIIRHLSKMSDQFCMEVLASLRGKHLSCPWAGLEECLAVFWVELCEEVFSAIQLGEQHRERRMK